SKVTASLPLQKRPTTSGSKASAARSSRKPSISTGRCRPLSRSTTGARRAPLTTPLTTGDKQQRKGQDAEPNFVIRCVFRTGGQSAAAGNLFVVWVPPACAAVAAAAVGP